MNQCQDKTNPSLVTGLRCKPYTRNPFDYRRLCESVLGWRVFRGNNCVTRAWGNVQMLVEVVVDFFAGIQFVRWRFRWGQVFLFLDLIYSLIIPQGCFVLRYTILGEDSTIECLAVPRFDMYDIMCNISSGISTSLVSSFSAWPSSCYSTATIIGQRNLMFPTLLVGFISCIYRFAFWWRERTI